MLFRKHWRNAATFRREVTIRTIPTECYPDGSDDGIKSQETILVWNASISLCESFFSLNFLDSNVISTSIPKIAGSSIRDESMYTTVTQKQSFDSMTVSQYQPVKLSNHSNPMKFQSNVMSSGHPIVSHAHVDEARNNRIGPITNKCSSNDSNAYRPEFVHDKINEIRISISCANKMKVQNPSRASQMLGGLFGWRQNTRNIGYYSPPMEHPIDKISIRLNTCAIASNHDAGHSVAATILSQPKGHVEFAATPMRNDSDDDADSISNSSMKDCNATALEDELSTYMKELRLRELR